jgi:hypothetical protein
MKKTPTKKKSETSSKKKVCVVELPSNNDDMERYLDTHREEIHVKMVDNIEYAIKNRLQSVEVFCFKDSSFVVIMNSKDFKENLQNIFDFSMGSENFELCGRVKSIMNVLDKVSHFFDYKKIK